MTTLFKAITRTAPRAINQNISVPQNLPAGGADYTRLIIRDLMVGTPGVCVNLNATVAKPKNWADKNIVRCENLIAAITAIQPTNNNIEMLAERIATECLLNGSVRDVTVRIEKRNSDGSYATTGVEIFRGQ